MHGQPHIRLYFNFMRENFIVNATIGLGVTVKNNSISIIVKVEISKFTDKNV